MFKVKVLRKHFNYLSYSIIQYRKLWQRGAVSTLPYFVSEDLLNRTDGSESIIRTMIRMCMDKNETFRIHAKHCLIITHCILVWILFVRKYFCAEVTSNAYRHIYILYHQYLIKGIFSLLKWLMQKYRTVHSYSITRGPFCADSLLVVNKKMNQYPTEKGYFTLS